MLIRFVVGLFVLVAVGVGAADDERAKTASAEVEKAIASGGQAEWREISTRLGAQGAGLRAGLTKIILSENGAESESVAAAVKILANHPDKSTILFALENIKLNGVVSGMLGDGDYVGKWPSVLILKKAGWAAVREIRRHVERNPRLDEESLTRIGAALGLICGRTELSALIGDWKLRARGRHAAAWNKIHEVSLVPVNKLIMK